MTLEELSAVAKQVRDRLPGLAAVSGENFRNNIRALVESALAQLNLVTREEFDAQAALLVRTREKLDRLEAIIAELEKHP